MDCEFIARFPLQMLKDTSISRFSNFCDLKRSLTDLGSLWWSPKWLSSSLWWSSQRKLSEVRSNCRRCRSSESHLKWIEIGHKTWNSQQELSNSRGKSPQSQRLIGSFEVRSLFKGLEDWSDRLECRGSDPGLDFFQLVMSEIFFIGSGPSSVWSIILASNQKFGYFLTNLTQKI